MDVPELDKRDLEALVQKMKKMVPYYTPEWRFSPEDPDPGTGLFMIFAEMYLENIRRFNRVPYKNFVAFLNLLDVSLLPAKPARTCLTFQLSQGAFEPVFVPQGTKVSGTNGEEEIIFETESPLLVSAAIPRLGYCTSGAKDMINELPPDILQRKAEESEVEAAPYEIFNFPPYHNLQEHCFYLGHDYLLNLQDTARLELEIINTLRRYREAPICEKLASTDNVEWLYSVGESWQPFGEIKAQGNRLVLIKDKVEEITEEEVEGATNRWIKCRVKRGRLHDMMTEKLELDGILMKTEYHDSWQKGGLDPELLFFNDIQLEEDAFYPFGEQLIPFSTFYLASREALSKKYGRISINFNLQLVPHKVQSTAEDPIDWKMIMKVKDFHKRETPNIRLLQVLWEYWNGEGWVRLFPTEKYEDLFSRSARQHVNITFDCPADLEKTAVNAQENYWIRARILKLDNIYSLDSVYLSPWIENLKIGYAYGERRFPPQRCITYNNLEYRNRTDDLYRPGKPFKPLYGLECPFPAFYLGFEMPPHKGPLGLFLSLEQSRQSGMAHLEWECLGRQGGASTWLSLKARDDTRSLAKSGIVTFSGPPELTPGSLFGHNLYWLRLVNPDSRLEGDELQRGLFPMLKGIYMNTVPALQQESVAEEIPERIPGVVPPVFRLSRTPVLTEEIWVDETELLGEESLARLSERALNPLKVIRTDAGAIQKVWVCWQGVKNFAASRADDRHYVMDYSLGMIRFGDGVRGAVPPLAGMERIKVKYSTGGGEKGNLPAWHVTNLQNSIAFVDKVYNPEAAGGGAAQELLEQALRRGPQVLKHQGRAVTVEDFEWLAREVSPEIARVKCLANYNGRMERQTGVTTVVLFPRGGAAGFTIFPELKAQVETYLRERAANLVSMQGKIQVVEAAMLEVSILAVLTVSHSEQVYPVELEAVEQLNKFLDPLRGNFGGQGWEIGKYVHVSVFYALLKSIGGVNHVEKLSMTLHKVEGMQRTEISPADLASVPHGIIVSGKHTVFVQPM